MLRKQLNSGSENRIRLSISVFVLVSNPTKSGWALLLKCPLPTHQVPATLSAIKYLFMRLKTFVRIDKDYLLGFPMFIELEI